MDGHILKSIWESQIEFNRLKKMKTQIGVYREVEVDLGGVGGKE